MRCFKWILVSTAMLATSGLLPAREVSAGDPKVELAEKLAAREQLQREIEELQRATRTPEQYLIHTELIELNRTACRKSGFDFLWPPDAPDSGEQPQAQSDGGQAGRQASKEFLETVRNLVEKGYGRILANPSLVTTSGRPAKFHAGGQIFLPAKKGAAAELKPFGTEVELHVESLGDGRAQLDLRLVKSEVDAKRSTRIAGEEYPGFARTEVSTACTAKIGETQMLRGLKSTNDSQDGQGPGKKGDEVELLLFVTLESTQGLAPKLGGPIGREVAAIERQASPQRLNVGDEVIVILRERDASHLLEYAGATCSGLRLAIPARVTECMGAGNSSRYKIAATGAGIQNATVQMSLSLSGEIAGESLRPGSAVPYSDIVNFHLKIREVAK